MLVLCGIYVGFSRRTGRLGEPVSSGQDGSCLSRDTSVQTAVILFHCQDHRDKGLIKGCTVHESIRGTNAFTLYVSKRSRLGGSETIAVLCFSSRVQGNN